MARNQSFCKGEFYAQRHKTYLAKSQQMESLLQALKLHLPSELESLFIKDDFYKVLSVGSGDGEVDLQVIRIIQDVSKKKVCSRIIKPNKYSFNKYKQSIQLLQSEMDGLCDQIIFDIDKPETFQDYMNEEKMDGARFDIVHFIHSLYFMDVEETLTHCYDNELADKGMIICFSGLYCIIPGVFEDNKSQKKQQSIFDVMNKYGWENRQHRVEFNIDVTEVFDDQSVSGNLLLDFLTQTLNFRTAVGKSKVQIVLDLICKSSVSVGKTRLYKYVNHLIFIRKQSNTIE